MANQQQIIKQTPTVGLVPQWWFRPVGLANSAFKAIAIPKISAPVPITSRRAMGTYDTHPKPFLERLYQSASGNSSNELFCAGFEMEEWRCTQFADHLIEWLPDYGLAEEELKFDHGNAYQKLKQAAARVYSSAKFKKRGELGEIALHAICRGFFKTIPISPRVFYKSTSNDVVKSFDLVHARFAQKKLEIWLGEAKLYDDRSSAMSAAIASITEHLDQGFLTNQKLLLGPQIPKSTPQYEEIRAIFESQVSLDKLLDAAVFVVGVLATSDAIQPAKKHDQHYQAEATKELVELSKKLAASGLAAKIRLVLVYVPLKDKQKFVADFDAKLKGLQL